MQTTTKKQGIISLFEQENHILSMVESFLVDRKARGSSSGTFEFYRKKLRLFTCASIAETILDVHCGMNVWKLCIASTSQWLLQKNIGHDLG